MEKKLVTIIVLPFSKAKILKMRLEEQKIESALEEINLLDEGATSVKVQVQDRDVKDAIPVLEDFLGKKEETLKTGDKQNEHILVPVDFSGQTLKTCKLAFNIASHLKAKLVFMHCYINPLIHSVPYADVYVYDSTLLARMDNAEKNANDNFKKFIRKLSAEIDKEEWKNVKSEFIIKPGYADEDILTYAHENNSMLIVMGTGGGNESTVGSITADVIYNAKVPVLVVPEKYHERKLNEFKKILYATNFGEKDFTAIEKLVRILKPLAIKVFCVHVAKDECSEWDKARLEGMKELLKSRYAEKDFDCRLLQGDDLLKTLDKFIKDENIDVISLTTHRRNLISRLFNPSVARKMVFHSQTPLLIFHA